MAKGGLGESREVKSVFALCGGKHVQNLFRLRKTSDRKRPPASSRPVTRLTGRWGEAVEEWGM